MSTLPAKKISEFYDSFNGVDVTFTKDMVGVTGLIPEQVQLKCGSDFWPCVFYSSSFRKAKIVINTTNDVLHKLSQSNNLGSLRLGFRNPESGNPLAFFVAFRVMGLSPYKGSKEVALMSLQFTQRPPDDFIEIIGRILDAKVNSAKHKTERIVITADTERKLRLASRKAVVFIQKVPRSCIIRELSFSGSKLIMMGVGRFLLDKDATLRVEFDDPGESFMLPGKFTGSEDVEGKQGMVALAMDFDDPKTSLGYKARINEYINRVSADSRGQDTAER